MSYLGWTPPQSPGRSLWRFFPAGLVAAMAVVVAVNVGMVYLALNGFPGQAGSQDFALSNHYDAVLERVRHEAELGWILLAQTDDAGRPVVMLNGPDNTPLQGASIAGYAARPLGASQSRTLTFSETAAGRYVGDVVLPYPGQWDLTLSASAEGHDLAATRRVIVR